ncbi:hypothetical protein GCM10023197_45260 [Gordonia humi]
MARLFADPSRLGSDKGDPRHACLCLFSLHKSSIYICMWVCEVFVDWWIIFYVIVRGDKEFLML